MLRVGCSYDLCLPEPVGIGMRTPFYLEYPHGVLSGTAQLTSGADAPAPRSERGSAIDLRNPRSVTGVWFLTRSE